MDRDRIKQLLEALRDNYFSYGPKDLSLMAGDLTGYPEDLILRMLGEVKLTHKQFPALVDMKVMLKSYQPKKPIEPKKTRGGKNETVKLGEIFKEMREDIK